MGGSGSSGKPSQGEARSKQRNLQVAFTSPKGLSASWERWLGTSDGCLGVMTPTRIRRIGV